jgi:four helix bundle protein
MEVAVAQDFRELRVWQDAMALAEAVYAATRLFPPEERFGLTSQLRRASVSTASCIAEGNARHSTRDYLRFLSMSSGSLAEIETQLLLARRFGYLSDEGISLLLAPLHGLARQLQALRKSLSSKLAANQMFPVPRSPFPAP